ncbi:HSP20-like chaperones superfamily protein [Striga asiatica]|uniref:HSP20-like chaperones superfamily protein n=1 Tax=Striga asiatica TaxID=4170 RepID=A0A5A7PX36_STRAF|nr:HSP20-like chaperones superfamily protein [Striga asiatica]
MGEDFLTGLSIENYPPSTFLSMDSIAACHEDPERDPNRQVILSGPPDINLPLSAERSPPPQPWAHDPSFDILDVGLGPQPNDSAIDLPKAGKKCGKRPDSVWGAWFFFSFYFKPVLKEKSKPNSTGFEKSDLQLDVFLVQHDMENMYMWVFKERPENALGKMQLRSYMNGHSRQGQRPFPFSVDKGFVRSHKMQRKQYRGLSNPQCLHGIELVPSPSLAGLDEEEQKRWVELTGRELNFSIPPEAKEFSSWRNLPSTDFDLDRSTLPVSRNKKLLNGSGLNLSTQTSAGPANGIDLLAVCNRKRKDLLSDENCCLMANGHLHEFGPVEPPWLAEFSGVMRNVYGPVTGAKTIYEDDEGYLILVTLPFADPEKVKVHWWNNLTHGVLKISSVSTGCMPFVQRKDRTFRLTDRAPEHCPPGEFRREIPLPTRIPDDANLEAYFDKSGTVLEIKVPKHRVGPEEHEVTVCLRPPNEFVLS